MHCLFTGAVTALAIGVAAAAAQAPAPAKQRIAFKSHGLTLTGFLFKPDGPGPFPSIIWNHGSEKNPGGGPQFDTVASIFVPHGYVVFAPIRRGHQMSEGRYILDERDAARGRGQAAQTIVRLHETERGVYKAAIAISPAAQSWGGNPMLRDRLLRAVRNIAVPVMLLQPAKDDSLEPSRVLGAEFVKLKKPYVGKVYPATGPDEEQHHCFGGARGMHVWADDAVAFLDRSVRP